MDQPHKVFLSSEDFFTLECEIPTDFKPLSVAMSEEKEASKFHQNESAESAAKSVGITFDVNSYVDQNTLIPKKLACTVKAVLHYLVAAVDKSVLKFSPDGKVFYLGRVVPGANLAHILVSLVSKKKAGMENGEFFVVASLTNAPDSLKALVNSKKLSLCNVQLQNVTKPPPADYSSQPLKKAAAKSIAKGESVKVCGSSPFPVLKGGGVELKRDNLLKSVKKNPLKPTPQIFHPSKQQQRFNVGFQSKAKPWFVLN